MNTTLSSVQSVGRPDRWPPHAVYIGMPGPAARGYGIEDRDVPGFGKPWTCRDDPRGWQIAYREYLFGRINRDAAFAQRVARLEGHLLLCWCTAKAAKRGVYVPCHGEILIEAIDLLNQI